MERERQAAWDRKHLKSVGTKLRRRDYEAFIAFCEAEGTTPYAWLQRFIKFCLEHA